MYGLKQHYLFPVTPAVMMIYYYFVLLLRFDPGSDFDNHLDANTPNYGFMKTSINRIL